MIARIVVALIWIPLHLSIIYFGRPVHYMIYMEVFALLMSLEFFAIMDAKGFRTHRMLVLLTGAGVIYLTWFNPYWNVLAVIIFVVLNLGLLAFRRKTQNAMADSGVTLLALFYVPIFLAFTVAIRGLPMGAYYLVIVFLGIWAYDSAAYFVGKAFGKHKLAPNISPKKSVEGLIGGAIAVFVGIPVLTHVLWPVIGFTWWETLLLAVIIIAGGTIGDLVESALKRDAVVKDSGGFLPGHGGMLDRFDGVLYSSPVLYLFFVYASGANLVAL